MNNTGKKLRLGVLLSGGGRTLVNITDRIKAGTLDAEVAVVVASRQCKGIQVSKATGLDVHLVEYKQYGEERLEEYSQKIAALLDAADVDLVIMAGFLSMWIIPPKYESRVMNIHPALLPKFGGQGMFGHYVHEAVIAAGETESGCTVHFVTNEYDKGPIVLQRSVPVLPEDTPDDLASRVFQQECEAFPEAIQMFARGEVKF
ncbi:MAG: phosphoribosylglycinamide formyltransferase [Phycisphaerae bacterium]|nr:phosphoribosylglycinamide formyltransferase [Phycisphaerae bacterium]